VETPLNASAITAGALISTSTFVVPPFQREYAWEEDEVSEFWGDLQQALTDENYFLGLVILTEEDDRQQVVDGQQRLLTISMLAAGLRQEALVAGRGALADRIRSDFLEAIDYETDAMRPRISLSDSRDDQTFQSILQEGSDTIDISRLGPDALSPKLASANKYLRRRLKDDLASNPFKRLGEWAEFLTNRVYFAVFIHPNPSAAYRVFEVINTRGRELTTADLLKNYILSKTPDSDRLSRYGRWREMAIALEPSGSGALVQYIRHVVTVTAGHIPPRDLFDYLSGRLRAGDHDRRPPTIEALMNELNSWVPLYMQIIDQTIAGPAEPDWLGVFSSLKELGVISVRPVAMALSLVPEPTEGLDHLLRLVVRRIVVGNLGTGNVERRLGEAARRIHQAGEWQGALAELEDLNPSRSDFVEQLRKRSLNMGTLTFLRRSIVQKSITPDLTGFTHLIRPRQAPEWEGFPDDEFTYWGSTIGNTLLANVERRPRHTSSWNGFRSALLPTASEGEFVHLIGSQDTWTARAVEHVGSELAEAGADVWYAKG
jgi:hypothetical protein